MHEIVLAPGDHPDHVLEMVEALVCAKKRYVVLRCDDLPGRRPDLHHMVREIRRLYDLFIVLELPVPSVEEEIDAVYALGVHGVLFCPDPLTDDCLKILRYATGVFLSGTLFTMIDSRGDREQLQDQVNALTEMGIIPVLPKDVTHRDALAEYIDRQIEWYRINTGWLRYINLNGEKHVQYHLSDYFKSRYLLELANLRHKLRVRSVEESYDSSGL